MSKKQDPETRKTQGPGPHWPVAPYTHTHTAVGVPRSQFDITHAHNRLSYCSFQGDNDFSLHGVATIQTRAFDRKFKRVQTSSEADSV